MDILTYSGGVYKVSKGEYPLGSHAVVWGEENEYPLLDSSKFVG